MNIIPKIVSISYAKRIIQNIGEKLETHYPHSIDSFDLTATKSKRLAAVSMQNEETNEFANKIINSEPLKDYSSTAICGVLRRLQNASELLSLYPDEYMFPLISEKKDFDDVLDFFLFAFDWDSDNGNCLYAFPKEELGNILRKASPHSWSIYDKKA